MTKEREALKLALEALENNRQTHHYCEDTWYSCPKHEDGCANESEGDECNCGADKANAEIDKAITAIKEALAQPERLAELGWQEIECPICGGGARAFPKPEQEPVAFVKGCNRGQWEIFPAKAYQIFEHEQPLYTTPPQRKPLSYEDLIECERLAGIRHRIHMGSIRGQQLSPADEFLWHYARAIEAAHGIKGEA